MKYKKMFLSTLCLSIMAIPLALFAWDSILFITPDEYADELEPLVSFKEYSTRYVYSVNLSELYGTYSGVDNPEKIKKCIEHYVKTYNVRHVVLVGDVNKMPVRWRWWGRWMPDDPYFTGAWAVTGGEYRQSNAVTELPYCSWLDIGSFQDYIIEADCKITGGVAGKREARIHFADADRHNGSQRIDLLPTQFRLFQCTGQPAVNKNFDLNQTFHIKIQVAASQVTVWIDNVQIATAPLASIAPGAFGKIGLGTYACSASFDNLVISSNSVVLVNENFNDGVANNFTDAPTMEERNWMPSDLYYADLFKSNGAFDDWDYNDNNLFGEIEFVLPVYNPNAVLNNDRIDYLPDVAVGRIPAYDADHVTRYVKKVIYYEMMTMQTASWFNRGVLFEGTTGGGAHNDNIAVNLQGKGMTVSNRRWTNDLGNMTNDQRKNLVVSNLNQGYGLVNYIGHGNTGEWSCVNFTHAEVKTQLTNSTMLPVVAASACFTGQFAPIPPTDAYIDVSDIAHTGTAACERFPGPPNQIYYSMPKALQVYNNPGCIAEDFLFFAGTPAGTGGAIVYLGERSAGRDGGNLLTEYFFSAYNKDATVGNMWKKMIVDYYTVKNFSQSQTWSYGPEKWADGHYFDEAQKFIVFGDPSVIVGGAFNRNLGGNIFNGNSPYFGYKCFRVTANLTIPAGQRLSIDSTSTLLFGHGKKITAMDSDPQNGLVINSGQGDLVCFLGEPKTPSASDELCGIIIRKELRMRNGGQIKFY